MFFIINGTSLFVYFDTTQCIPQTTGCIFPIQSDESELGVWGWCMLGIRTLFCAIQFANHYHWLGGGVFLGRKLLPCLSLRILFTSLTPLQQSSLYLTWELPSYCAICLHLTFNSSALTSPELTSPPTLSVSPCQPFLLLTLSLSQSFIMDLSECCCSPCSSGLGFSSFRKVYFFFLVNFTYF